MSGNNIGALIIRIGFGGRLYYNYNKEPPKILLVLMAPILGSGGGRVGIFSLKPHRLKTEAEEEQVQRKTADPRNVQVCIMRAHICSPNPRPPLIRQVLPRRFRNSPTSSS